MSDIPSFAYNLFWGERIVRSVANLTHEDGWKFLEIAAKVPVKTEVQTFLLKRLTRLWISCVKERLRVLQF